MDYFNQKSERLLYRKVEMTDIESWTDFFIDNDNLPYMGIPDLSKDAAVLAEEWITIQFKRYETLGTGHLSVIKKDTNELIGMCGIIPRDIMDSKKFEVAYSLKPRFWGKGYGTEMAKQMKNFGLKNEMASQFISIIAKRNAASIHVAKKNGMRVLCETAYLGMEVFVYGT